MLKIKGAGGTSGGIGSFFLGLLMVIGGGYLLLNHVMVSSGSWYIWGHSAFGMTLIPLLFGIGILFFNGRSIVGWILTLGGGAMILFGIISRLDIYFRPTSLFNTLLMLTMLVGGLGLVARALREH
ncbi:hypothetical protein [Candidatus Magnetominusculus xianensis]|uniref:Uncharacterized protein n=1 Tax=Candidatus Magnetominusculus xianensis TaxID=1748249 RepID=A0ABR5SB28_9BACT|nr:hypothetical protein [Candidatus Magnetominusculus xianensis]KWT75935.1 hypothetical protein ASN18_3175 [Candidatus Magnetominusculus xianensis]